MDNKSLHTPNHNPQNFQAQLILGAWHNYRDIIDSDPDSIENLNLSDFELPYVEMPGHDQTVQINPEITIDPSKSLLIEHNIGDVSEKLRMRIVSNREEDMHQPEDQIVIKADLDNNIQDVQRGFRPLELYHSLIEGAIIWKEKYGTTTPQG